MKRYAKFSYAAPFRFPSYPRKTTGGGGQNAPPPTRANVNQVNL